MLDTETKKGTSKVSLEDVFLSFFLAIVIVSFIFGIYVLLEMGLQVAPSILISSISNMPINSGDAYPTLLQGLIIAASMLFGFYTFLLFEFVKYINEFFNKHLSGDRVDHYFKKMFKSSAITIMIIPIGFLFISIFFAFYATIFYGQTLTYTTEQISTNSIITNSIPANVLNIWNSTYYFELIKNNNTLGITAYHYYQTLNASTQGSIRMLYLASSIIISISLFYVLSVFGLVEYFINKHKAIGSFIALGISASFLYLFKLYLALYVIVAVSMIASILLVYLYRKGAKGNKKDIVATKTTEKTGPDSLKI